MIRDELPELAKLMDDAEEIYSELRSRDNESFWAEWEESVGEPPEFFTQLNLLAEDWKRIIEANSLSAEAKARFAAAVNADLVDATLLGLHIQIEVAPGPGTVAKTDWFDRHVFAEGDVLDSWLTYRVLHPDLLDEAKTHWVGHARVKFPSQIDEDLLPHSVENKRALLTGHGVPDDLSTWHWAYEALRAGEAGLRRLNLDFRLCDFVEWTCTGEPPNLHQNEIFGEPTLYSETGFGSRVKDDESFERLDGCKIWKKSEGLFISPLWEYLAWSNGGRVGEIARYLSDIGEGIDAALISLDPDFYPEDRSITRLAPTRIFRAGEAMIRLRVALELGETVLKGKRADAATKTRALKGGAKSTEARNNRIASLLAQMGSVAQIR